MNLKKIKIIFYLPIALFFIATFFHCPTQVKADDSMPNWKMPELQIKIPGLNFTSISTIFQKCEKDNKNKITNCAFPWIGEYIAGVYKYAIGIVGILAAVVLMVGGVLWIIAGGNATTIGEAKAWIGASLTGLVIALTSYTILYQVNPALVEFKPITLGIVQKIALDMVNQRFGGTGKAADYKKMPCPTTAELSAAKGVKFYATAYYKYPHKDNSLYTRCMIHMQCSDCPNGVAKDENCDDIFPKLGYRYYPCNPFDNEDYCKKTSSGNKPKWGDIAVDPKCISKGEQVCIQKTGLQGKTFTAVDTGGAIEGRRIDIWSENNLSLAKPYTGEIMITLGKCQ